MARDLARYTAYTSWARQRTELQVWMVRRVRMVQRAGCGKPVAHFLIARNTAQRQAVFVH